MNNGLPSVPVCLSSFAEPSLDDQIGIEVTVILNEKASGASFHHLILDKQQWVLAADIQRLKF